MILPQILLPDGMTEMVFAILVTTSFVASLITVAFGIGGGGVMLAVMATLVPPAALIPTHGVIQVGSNLGRALVTLRHIFWPAVPAFALGSLIGAAMGGALVINLPPEWVQIGVGAFVIWSVLGRPPRGVRDWPVVVGAVSSFLTMFFGATGLFVATFTKSQNLPRHAHVATHATLMTVQHGVKSLTFGLLGFAFADWWPFIIVMIAAGFCGTLVGKTLLNRIDDRRFKIALDVILILLSLRLIYSGLRQLFTGA
ncbi:sulfite exporter TauE/SafE family protein [Puniceibacterium sp. IMCC21224]|uniref:sulfite exporter TauE/SafE family protein n=1 Tax=Puniceibacterium sp. IMCC21224 TaxID=1618204 RepID=UPI00064DE4D4|nr:sulfite exporter TauE/SafE family protein [Puniceibacterium sp. IMCC21224]KMK68826.1 putative permease [Puniceibacterium sp. IMCC21224]